MADAESELDPEVARAFEAGDFDALRGLSATPERLLRATSPDPIAVAVLLLCAFGLGAVCVHYLGSA